MPTVALLLLSLLAVCFAVIVPSIRIETCENEDNCEQKILLLATVNKEGSSWAVDATFNEPLEDDLGRLFLPAQPVRLTIHKPFQKTIYPLARSTDYLNAFEQEQSRVSGSLCDSSKLLCCDGFTRTLSNNSTLYQSYSLGSPRTEFQIEVRATQGDFTTSVFLTPSHREDAEPGIAATLVTSSTLNPPPTSTSRLFIDTSRQYSEGFLVPQYFLGSRPNLIGITKTAWMLDANCNYPKGYLVQVNGGSVYDQFSRFRQQTLSQMGPLCTWQASWSNLEASPGYMGYDCDLQQTEIISMELSASKIRLIKMFAEPQVTDKGLLPYAPLDQYLYLFVDVMNLGTYDGLVTVEINSCTPALNFVQKSIELHSAPQATSRYLFRLPEWPENVAGTCGLSVLQHGIVSTQVNVSFTLPKRADSLPSDNLTPVGSGDNDQCQLPNQLVTKNGVLYCRHPCSEDQQYIAAQGSANATCIPVDCHTKYAGARDYYNSDTKLCEAVLFCPDPLILDFQSNTCQPKSTGSPTSTTLSPSPTKRVGGLSPASGSLQCGAHGEMSEDGLSCLCDSGWISDPNQDMFSFQWCTVPYKPAGSATNSTVPAPTGATGGWRGFVTKFKYPLLGVAAVLLLALCLITTIVLACGWKRYIAPRLKKKKSQNHIPSTPLSCPIDIREGRNPYLDPSPRFVLVPMEQFRR